MKLWANQVTIESKSITCITHGGASLEEHSEGVYVCFDEQAYWFEPEEKELAYEVFEAWVKSHTYATDEKEMCFYCDNPVNDNEELCSKCIKEYGHLVY